MSILGPQGHLPLLSQHLQGTSYPVPQCYLTYSQDLEYGQQEEHSGGWELGSGKDEEKVREKEAVRDPEVEGQRQQEPLPQRLRP